MALNNKSNRRVRIVSRISLNITAVFVVYMTMKLNTLEYFTAINVKFVELEVKKLLFTAIHARLVST